MSDPSQEKPDTDELAHLKDLAQTHGKTSLIVLAVLLLLVLGIRTYRARKQATRQEASAMFGSARSAEQLKNLVEEYKSAPSTPLAKLRLAKTYFDATDFDKALATYNEIKAEGPGRSPVSDAAELGIASSLEAKRQTEEALERFDAFIQRNPDNFLMPQAVLGKARCLDKLYRTVEAKAVMEDYIAANPESTWAGPAEELLRKLNRKLAAIPFPEEFTPPEQ